MIMMIKRNDNWYQLLMQSPSKLDEFAVVSELTKKDYEWMLSFFRMIRSDSAETTYIFPRPNTGVYTVVNAFRRSLDDYVIEANYNCILSEMVGVELDLMIFELECLPNHRVGTPAYFPPPKEKANDR